MQVLKNKRKHNDELFNGIPIRVLVYTTVRALSYVM